MQDVSSAALDWRRKHGRREAGAAPQASRETPTLPGPALIFGEAFVEMGRNLGDNLAADRVRILEGVWRRV